VKVCRGDFWWADLNPVRGSEQAGRRPALIYQNDQINRFTTTVLAIPLTTNLRRAGLPSCVEIPKKGTGLAEDSIAICHQLRALDKERLKERIGVLDEAILAAVDQCMAFTLGMP
jgi:mRNA interferase MazF